MLDSQMSGHLIVKKSALLEKHGFEWKMLEFISFCAIYSLPIWFFPLWISCIRIHLQKNRLNCSRVDISMPSIALIWITAASISPRGFITFLFFSSFFKFSTIQFIVICTYVYIHICESSWDIQNFHCLWKLQMNTRDNGLLCFSCFELHFQRYTLFYL